MSFWAFVVTVLLNGGAYHLRVLFNLVASCALDSPSPFRLLVVWSTLS
jgi:hypothetical protein